MIKKIYNSNYPVYHSAKDVKKFLKEAVDVFEKKKNLDVLITKDDTCEWVLEELERLRYDYDALKEDEIYSNVLEYPVLCPEEKLLDYQKEKMESLPVEVVIKPSLLIVEIKGLLKRNDYINKHLVHNLANSIDAKINFYENENSKKVSELFGSNQYSLYVVRYIKKGRTSATVCDPSNIELSHIINTVVRRLGLSDSYQGMINYSVRYESLEPESRAIKKMKQESTVLLFGDQDKIDLYLGGFEVD